MKPALILLAAACVALPACAVAPTVTTTDAGAGAGVTCTYRITNRPAQAVDPPSGTGVPNAGTSTVVLHFAAGDVTVTLDRAGAPCAAHSFESLAQQGFYNDTSCHRMGTGQYPFLQCGDPTGTGTGGPGYWFDDELAHVTGYPKGAVAMANSGKNTNGSQFFILYGDAPFKPDYTVFGHVDDKGVAVIAGLAASGTDNAEGAGFGRPKADARIVSASVG